MLVEIVPGRARADVVLGAIDSTLAASGPGTVVRVELETGDSRRDPLMELAAADGRVLIAAPGTDKPAAEIRVTMPATARPASRSLSAITEIIRSGNLATVAVSLPLSLRSAGAGRRLRAVAPAGSGSRRLRAADVELRSVASRRPEVPPRAPTMASERAEHLRHRARGATMRARVDRNSHRLARERLQFRHERLRLRHAERRIAASGAAEWIQWRARNVARRVAGAPALVLSAANMARSYGRRARRFAVDRVRSRRATG